MRDPLSVTTFYARNKRKVMPVTAILALAILGIVVEDSLLASAKETAYATFGSYQKIILVAPRPTSNEDLANPLRDAMARLQDVQGGLQALDGPGGLSAYIASAAAIPAELEQQRPLVDQLQRDAATAGYYAARLRGDLQPMQQLLSRLQRLRDQEAAVGQLYEQLRRNPTDLPALMSYLQHYQSVLPSLLPPAGEVARLEGAATGAVADAQGLQWSLGRLSQSAAQLSAASSRVAELPPPPRVEESLSPFRSALTQLSVALASFQRPVADLDALRAASERLPGTRFVLTDAYSNIDINLLAGNAQFDLYGVTPAGMRQLIDLYGDRLKSGRLPEPDANEIVLSEEVVRARGLALGGLVGNAVNELDRLPDTFRLVGVLEGPTRLGMIPMEYMTQHYLFERRYQGLVVVPEPGMERQVYAELNDLIADRPLRLFDWTYIRDKIDSLIANLDTINRFLVLLVIVVLSLVVGLLNYLSFRQRMNEFGLLAAIGHSRLSLLRRVALESVWVTLAGWLAGVGAGLAILWWFNQVFMIPRGLLLEVFSVGPVVRHTVPLVIMAFVFGLGTVAWQLVRMDPILIIERRD